ncbi:MAG TPA: S41 family peptidase [Patescibacteria group bacterium]|nr:S41 family peptidase [Patescibacteria group bacterium]
MNSSLPTNALPDGQKSRIFFKKSLVFYTVAVLIIIVFAAGFWVGKKESSRAVVTASGQATTTYGDLQGKNDPVPAYLSQDVNFKIFWDVWSKIQDKYIDRPVGETKLFYGALAGLVASLEDPYSSFMEPQIATEFQEGLAGKFEGIGAEIGIRNDVLTIITPLVESPAEKAGLLAADVILEIDGFKTEKIDVNEAVRRIRGDKGTTVTLKIYRPKEQKVMDVPVVRDVIKIVSAEFHKINQAQYPELGAKKINLIKVTNFNADTEERFRNAIEEVKKDNPDGLILDLRSNPGGYLDTAIFLANAWVEQGKTIVMEKFINDQKLNLAPNVPELNKFKTVVLVNGGSASSSEIVAGALQDHALATIIGEKTFGKGSVQQLEDLADGSAVKLTIARWLTPKGRTIDKEGITPDITVERTVDDINNGQDPQLDRAIQFFVEGK